MRGVGTFTRGLILLAIVSIYPLLLLKSFSSSTSTDWSGITDTTWFAVSVAAVCGMLGSVISILLRLSEFETTKGRSQMFLVLTGATLPLVGGVFGAFVAALLSAKVVNIQIGGTEAQNTWLYVVLGFLSGFSERFSRGFISIAEDRLGPGGASSQHQQQTWGPTVEARVVGTITPDYNGPSKIIASSIGMGGRTHVDRRQRGAAVREYDYTHVLARRSHGWSVRGHSSLLR